MRRVLAAACALLLSCHPSGRSIEIMLPPWFSPDGTHPSLQAIFDAFRRENPEVRLRYGPGKADLLWEKLNLLEKEGRVPDVIMFKTSWTHDLAQRGILAPLPARVAGAVVAQANEALVPVVSQGACVWALPYDMDVRLIHYRVDLVAATGLSPPARGWTLDQFVALAQALTKDTNGDGRPDVWGFAVPCARSQTSVAQFLPWAWAFGARLPAEGTWRIDQEGIVRAIATYRALRDSLRVAPPDLHVLEQADVFKGLSEGRFAMTQGGSWEIMMLRTTSRFGDRIAQVPLPSIHGQEPMTSTDGWAFGLTTHDPRRQEVLAPLLEALFSERHQRQKLLDHGWLPTLRQGVVWVEEELGADVAWMLQRCRSAPGGPGWTRASLALGDALQLALTEGSGPAAAVTYAQRRMERASR